MGEIDDIPDIKIKVPFMINPLWKLSDEEIRCLADAARILVREKFDEDTLGLWTGSCKQPKINYIKFILPWVFALIILIFVFAIIYVGVCGCH